MREDPEIAAMMDDIQRNGPDAAQKYMHNEELMFRVTQIAERFRAEDPRIAQMTQQFTAEDKRELRRRAKEQRRLAVAQAKDAQRFAELQAQRAAEDAAAWQAMQREMASSAADAEAWEAMQREMAEMEK